MCLHFTVTLNFLFLVVLLVSHHDPELTFNHSFIEPPSGWVSDSFETDEDGEAVYCVPPREGIGLYVTPLTCGIHTCAFNFPQKCHLIKQLVLCFSQTYQLWQEVSSSSRKWAPSVTSYLSHQRSAARTCLWLSAYRGPLALPNPSDLLFPLRKALSSAQKSVVARIRRLSVSPKLHGES